MIPYDPGLIRPIWERALEAEIGITIPTSNPKILRHELLTARSTWSDRVKFEDLMTFLPEGKMEVFIVRKTVEVPDP